MKVLELMNRWQETYKAKEADYGASWLKTGTLLDTFFDGKQINIRNQTDINVLAVMVRVMDKLSRFTNLWFFSKSNQVQEPLVDTLCDAGVYMFMLAQLVSQTEETEDQVLPPTLDEFKAMLASQRVDKSVVTLKDLESK